MPLVVKRRQMPGLREPMKSQSYGSDCVRIGLVNNMPDAALEDTEKQFFSLLDTGSGEIPVHVTLYSLDGIPRGEQGQLHIRNYYSGFRELVNDRPDALIVTGTEPREQDLRKETYWGALSQLLDWAERETTSTLLSCLASHASVLHSDGIVRERLAQKRFGIFKETMIHDCPLTAGFTRFVRMPHSRWNDLREMDLTAAGYLVLTRSENGGVGLFAKPKGNSLFLYSQGHPEYSTQTLLKEYRRDVKRFLTGERNTYPEMPQDYFDEESSTILAEFQEQTLANPSKTAALAFPYEAISERVRNGWHSFGATLYGNWLRHIYMRKHKAAKQLQRAS
jgi:homoserine O-succinyltransferase